MRTIRQRKRGLEKRVKEKAFDLREILNPSDIKPEYESFKSTPICERTRYESWDEIPDDRIWREINEYATTCVTEGGGEYKRDIKKLSVLLCMEEAPRVPMDHLVFDDVTDAIVKGYWPHKVSIDEFADIIRAHDAIPREIESKAATQISGWVAESIAESFFTEENNGE